MKKIILVCLLAVLILVACAPPGYTPEPPKETPIPSVVGTKLYSIYDGWYRLDYMEDKENGYACYIYDGSDSGSIFCFKIDK